MEQFEGQINGLENVKGKVNLEAAKMSSLVTAGWVGTEWWPA